MSEQRIQQQQCVRLAMHRQHQHEDRRHRVSRMRWHMRIYGLTIVREAQAIWLGTVTCCEQVKVALQGAGGDDGSVQH